MAEETDSAELEAVMVRGRDEDTAGEVLARAKVAGALFGPEATTVLGRFRILDRLGAGGMGVVHAAYDPDLDRGVALKLVRVPAGSRDAALGEAKALARLSHPNVVPIFDVGIAGDHVYLVMELVRGKTLGRWAVGRGLHDILDAYRQAGAALVAAHQAGLVHRDFKPENAIVGGDGRVRVVDFGLACEADDPQRATGARRIAGTPKYMAPEQARGAAVTAAADQYSFCVALDEALTEIADKPRWVTAVIERGRAAEPAARFASMGELLAALARSPQRRWRRIAVAAAVAASIAAIAFIVGRRDATGEACARAGDRLSRAWPTTLERLDGFGAYGSAVRKMVAPTLDAYAVRWSTGSRNACLDHRAGAQSDTLFDLRTACLARAVSAWATVGEVIDNVDASTLADVPRAVQALPDPDACADLNALLAAPAPPAAIAKRVEDVRLALARSVVLLAAGRLPAADEAVGKVVTDARTLDVPALLAEVLLVEGRVKMVRDRSGAVPIFAEAQALAIIAGADALAIEAWARRAYVNGTSKNPDGALAGFDIITTLAKRATATSFSRALLYNNAGSVELARGHRERARAAFALAADHARTVNGANALELVNIQANLALVTDDRQRADGLLQTAAGLLGERLGGDHPDTLRVRWLRAGTVDDPRAAAEVLEPVCHAYELHPHLAEHVVTCWMEIGFLRLELDDPVTAIAALERATRWQTGKELLLGGYRALASGAPETAVSRFREALADAGAKPFEGWWSNLELGEIRLGLGRAQRALGHDADARAMLATSIADLEGVVRGHPSAAYERRLRRARAELAAIIR